MSERAKGPLTDEEILEIAWITVLKDAPVMDREILDFSRALLAEAGEQVIAEMAHSIGHYHAEPPCHQETCQVAEAHAIIKRILGMKEDPMPADRSPEQEARDALRVAHAQIDRTHAKDGCDCIGQAVGECCKEVRDEQRLAFRRAVLVARFAQASRSVNTGQFAIDIGSTVAACHQRLMAERDRLRAEVEGDGK